MALVHLVCRGSLVMIMESKVLASSLRHLGQHCVCLFSLLPLRVSTCSWVLARHLRPVRLFAVYFE